MTTQDLSHRPAARTRGIPTRVRIVMAAAGVATTLALVCIGGVSASRASAATAESMPVRLAHARTIGADVNARARRLPGAKLAVSEPTPTDVVESFTLLSQNLLETRYISAEGGVWYEICPVKAACPYPAARHARPAADYLPRRLALELAVRTFAETDASVVGVSLPTPRFVAFIVTREELAREGDIAALSQSLRESSMLALSASERHLADELTRPRTYVFLGLEPGPNGGPSWGGIPRWPVDA